MNKKYIIAAILSIMLLSAVGYIFWIKNRPIVSPEKIDVQNPQKLFPIDEIRKSPGAALSPNDTLLRSNAEYDIVFFDFGPNDKSFLIAIKSPAVEPAREKAEADFVQFLNIAKEQACTLKVSLRVSKDANESLSGGEYGLSFCPNGQPFPKN